MTLQIKDGNQQLQPISTQLDGTQNFVPAHCPAPLVNGVATPVSAANPMPVQVIGPGSGVNLARVNALSSTNAVNLKGAAGTINGWLLSNAAASARFFRFFNTGAVIPGTTVPLFTIVLPANSQPSAVFPPEPIPVSIGLGYDITGANGDTDATAITANDVTGFVLWT